MFAEIMSLFYKVVVSIYYAINKNSCLYLTNIHYTLAEHTQITIYADVQFINNNHSISS